MVRALFWNVQRRALDAAVLEIAKAERSNLVLLAEVPLANPSSWQLLTSHGLSERTTGDRFGVFADGTVAVEELVPPAGTSRTAYFRIAGPGPQDGLLVLVHGPDRRNYSNDSRQIFFARIAENVRWFEREIFGHRRTVVVGDFNANPYESAVVSAAGMHAIGIRTLRGGLGRTVLGQPADFFYNPMWRKFGHSSDAGSASYFYASNESTETYWHMLDQVVIRPEIIDTFPESELQIVSTAGGMDLTDEFGIPGANQSSDQLPLVFEWRL